MMMMLMMLMLMLAMLMLMMWRMVVDVGIARIGRVWRRAGSSTIAMMMMMVTVQRLMGSMH